MKKLLAILTVVALVMSVCTMSVFAEAITKCDCGRYHAVGEANCGKTSGDPNALVNGSNNPNGSVSTNVTLQLGDKTPKYAVDITFSNGAFALTADGLTWDVNKLVYDVDMGKSTNLQDQTYNIEITNYSDRPVWAEGKASLEKVVSEAATGIEFKMVGSAKFKVEAVNTSATEGSRTPVKKTMQASLTSGDWKTAVESLIAKINDVDGKITLGTITVSISGEEPNSGSN